MPLMSLLELPHTQGCLVCGRSNPHGLKLSLHINPATSLVSVSFTPLPHHIGFAGIVHGGVLATILDEAMVWAATWHFKRFCVCGEMNIRFRHPASIGQKLTIEARTESARPKLISNTAQVTTDAGAVIATATGKYVPLPFDRNQVFLTTLLEEPATHAAAAMLRAGDTGALGGED